MDVKSIKKDRSRMERIGDTRKDDQRYRSSSNDAQDIHRKVRRLSFVSSSSGEESISEGEDHHDDKTLRNSGKSSKRRSKKHIPPQSEHQDQPPRQAQTPHSLGSNIGSHARDGPEQQQQTLFSLMQPRIAEEQANAHHEAYKDQEYAKKRENAGRINVLSGLAYNQSMHKENAVS